MSQIRNQIRTLLRIRRQRRLLPAGPKPSVGARIVRDDVRMSVQAGMSDTLWEWLLKRGWREVVYRPERRRYNEVPSAWVTRLYEAAPADRSRVLVAAVQAARSSESTWFDPAAEESQDFA